MTNTLNLTIAEPWFSKIASGEKLEEYREIKDYYRSRFFDGWDKVKANSFYWYNEMFQQHPQFKNFDFLILRNGYKSNSRKIIINNPIIKIGKGRPEWGAEPGKLYFVITWEVFENEMRRIARTMV